MCMYIPVRVQQLASRNARASPAASPPAGARKFSLGACSRRRQLVHERLRHEFLIPSPRPVLDCSAISVALLRCFYFCSLSVFSCFHSISTIFGLFLSLIISFCEFIPFSYRLVFLRIHLLFPPSYIFPCALSLSLFPIFSFLHFFFSLLPSLLHLRDLLILFTSSPSFFSPSFLLLFLVFLLLFALLLGSK